MFSLGFFVLDANVMKAIVEEEAARTAKVAMTGVRYKTLITNMVHSKPFAENDIGNFSGQFETSSGRKVTVRGLNRKDYEINHIEVLLEEIIDVEVSLCEIGNYYGNDLKEMLLVQSMNYSLDIIYAKIMHEHGKLCRRW